MMRFMIFLLTALLVSSASALVFSTDSLPAGLNNAGYYLYEEGKAGAAEELFLRAVDADASYERARYNLATLYFEQGRYGEAVGQLDALVQLDAENPRYQYDLAVNLVERVRRDGAGLDRFAEALDRYRIADSLEPGFAHAAENAAVLERFFA